MSKAYIIDPYTVDIGEFDLTATHIDEMKTLGDTFETAFVDGNLILSSAGAANDDKSVEWAFFTGDIDPNAIGFNKADPNVATIRGMAVIVGPKQDDGTYADVTLSEDELDKRTGFLPPDPLEILKKLAKAQMANVAVDRDDVTYDELLECGCNGCMDELERREKGTPKGLPKAANGATLH
jgi:hypothetical protein